MNAKEAVRAAKEHIYEMLGDEDPSNVGLEEIEYLDDENAWAVTIGFSRPWNSARNAITALTGESIAKRTFRVVKISEEGNLVSIKRRDFTAQNVSDID